MRYALGSLLFISAVWFAQALTARSWNGVVYLYRGERRAPAAVRAAQDYLPLDRGTLTRPLQEQLLGLTQIIRRGPNLGLRLGHPLLRREDGTREFACANATGDGVYDRMELVFYGVGAMDSGEPPLLTVDVECSAEYELDHLDPIWIPMDEIARGALKEHRREWLGEESQRVTVEHMPAVWPESWVLYSVRLYNAESGAPDLVLDSARLRATGQALPKLEWDLR